MKKISQPFNSQHVTAMEQYLASTDEWEIVCYFLVFQEIRECPKEIKYPVIDHLVIEQLSILNHNRLRVIDQCWNKE